MRLSNGIKIEFSNKGKWTSVNCGKKELPEGLVPGAIRRYIAKNFSELKAVSICKRSGGYDIGLSDGNTHRFNLLHTSTKALSPPKIDRHRHKNRQAALRSIAQRRLSWCGFIISELAAIEDVENHLIFNVLFQCSSSHDWAFKVHVFLLFCISNIVKLGNEIRPNWVIHRIKITDIDNFYCAIFPLDVFLLVVGDDKKVLAVEFFGGFDEGVEFAFAGFSEVMS